VKFTYRLFRISIIIIRNLNFANRHPLSSDGVSAGTYHEKSSPEAKDDPVDQLVAERQPSR
jgi:hypothetical protein